MVLVGADGAGKSTITELVARELPLPAPRAYLGDDPPAGVPVLSTTRWFRRRWAAAECANSLAAVYSKDAVDGSTFTAGPAEDTPGTTSPARRLRRNAAHIAMVANTMAEEYHQMRRALREAAHGKVVLLDRHFYYDYYFHHIVVRPPALIDRVHGRWVAWVLPRPSQTRLRPGSARDTRPSRCCLARPVYVP